jgi:hypothetical protein
LKYGRVIVVILLMNIVFTSQASAGSTRFGAKVGISTSNAYDVAEGWEDAIDWKTGLTAGAFLNYAFNDNFSLQPELLYTQKGFGSALLDETDFFEADLTLSLDYFELPVLAKYAFSADRKFRPALFAGPSFAYCSSSTLKISSWIFSGDIDFSSLTHTTDFGLILGGGFDYVLEGGTLVFDVRLNYGLTNVIVSGDFEIDGSTETIEEDDFKNYSLSFTLGYIF